MPNVFINEIHYDNGGTDTGEFVEIAGPAGTDLTGWTIVLYNGSNRSSYATTPLTGVIAGQQNGFGTISVGYPANGIQNGGAGASNEGDGIALVDAGGNVVQFLSWEGSFLAANGPAEGMTSTNVGTGTFENGSQTGTSIGLVGSGTASEDFTWALIADDTPGAVNAGQTFGDDTPPPAPAGTLDVADATVAEGDSGTREIVLTVSRTGGSAGAVSATWTLGFDSANATDLGAGQATSGTVTFADGATSAEIRIAVQGDTAFEPNETFTVTLSGPQGGVALGDSVATGTITNDDTAPPAAPANVFINEIHYDNSSTDVGEAIEIAGAAGTDLTGYSLVLYNGTNTPGAAPAYNTRALSGVIDDEGNGFGAVSFAYPVNGIQNGVADGVALIGPDGTVIQFLSYSGTITAAAGTPAGGMTSTDIGVAEVPAPGVGFSLQLTGAGSSAADFAWSGPADDSFGSVNVGQSFLSATGTGQIRIADGSIAEGDSGTTSLVFTVSRAGGTALAASVGYTVNLDGTADAADLAAGAILSGTVSFAAGETSKQIVVAINGDTIGEGNETLSVTLGTPTGDVAITRGTAIGTIVNDDLTALAIGQIQGEGHSSAYAGQTIITNGVVTAIDSNGFYLQSATGDGNARTSDGIFVFTGSAPAVSVGDEATVRGQVTEYLPEAGDLTVTQIVSTAVTIASSGNALPAAVLIGTGGILPPTQVIDDDGLTSFDPATDGIDFWESLEGMRVTLDAPQAVSNTNNFGETDVVVSRGVGATGLNDRGGITISPNGGGTIDYNPEKIQIDDDSGVFAGFTPGYSVGDQITSVTGVVNYSFSNFEVVVIEAVSVTRDVTLERETTTLRGDANNLSIATYNLENLDVSDNKFDILASDIVYRLGAPDILAAQEIQDADGAGGGSDLTGTVTAQGLIDAIFTQSGLRYAYVEVAPTTAGTTGGEPGGNIRNGFFYNLDRVDYVEGSATLITGSAYTGSRNPLVAQFGFAGQTITAIDVHFTSRGGSQELYGSNQPPADAGDAARTAQAAGVKAYIQAQIAADPAFNVALLGDFNGFYFERSQSQLTDPAQGGVLTNLNTLLPAEERYSYIFNGNAQQLDNILVSGGLVGNAQYDAVHLNSQLGGSRPTDHDPQVALLRLGAAPTALGISNASVEENLPAGTVVGTLAATDTANDRLAYALADDAGGLFTVDAATGVVTTTAALDRETAASYQIVATATDTGGLSTRATLTIAVADVNEAPTAANDAIAVDEDARTANLWSVLLGNDRDPDAGQTLAISAVDTAGSLGRVVFDAAQQSLVYVANTAAFDSLAPGATRIDQFSYTVSDGNGLTSTATVAVTVTGVGGVTLNGTSDADTLVGTSFNDVLSGLGGNDILDGGTGADRLDGGAGDDRVFYDAADITVLGGLGTDTLLLRTGETVDLSNPGFTQVAGKAVFSFENVDASGASAAVDLRGSQFNNVLIGGSGADTLQGGGGTDTLNGGAGNDILDGGLGADRIDGGAGDDRVVYDAADTMVMGGQGSDTLVLLTGAIVNLGNFSSSQIAGKTVVNFENADASGASAAVDLRGSQNNNVLIGGSGADALYGGGGYDRLTGGAGNDRFVFDTLASAAIGRTTITDLASGDTIDLSGIDAVAGGSDDAFSFIGTSGFTGTAGQLRYRAGGGGQLVEGDIDGDGVADFSILIASGMVQQDYFVL